MEQDFYGNTIEDQRAESVFIHESSYVDAPCRIGANTSILHFSHVMANSIIGDNCYIGHNVTIASGVMLGNDVRVNNNALLNSGVIMEQGVYCGPSTIFAQGNHVRAASGPISRVSPTLVKQGAKIGANTTVASGHTIGRFAFIEAGSVIDSHVPDFAIIFGNPLKFGGWQCECGQALRFARDTSQKHTDCERCGRVYRQDSKWKIILVSEEANPIDPYSGFDPPVSGTQA